MNPKKTSKTSSAHVAAHAPVAKTATSEPTTTAAHATPSAVTVPIEIQASPSTSTLATPAPGSLEAKVLQLIAQLATIPILLGSQASPAAPLTIQDRRSVPSMKTGAEKEIPVVLDLADQYGVVLPGGTTAQARVDLQRATTLDTLAARLASALLLVRDESRRSKGRTWKMTRRAYKVLAGLVPDFPALQTELEPMASFMATKHKDAPTILRQAEAKTLAKTRATRANKDQAKASAGTPAATPVVQPPPVAEPVVQPAPVAEPAVQAPAAALPAPSNGAGHN